MGGCISHVKREMAPIPIHSGNWQGLSPQRPETYVPQNREIRKFPTNTGNGAPLGRFETPSGIPGLSYDQAGRPVWREPNAIKSSTEHQEYR